MPSRPAPWWRTLEHADPVTSTALLARHHAGQPMTSTYSGPSPPPFPFPSPTPPSLQTKEFNAMQPVGLVLDEGLASETDSYTVFYGERTPWWVTQLQSLTLQLQSLTLPLQVGHRHRRRPHRPRLPLHPGRFNRRGSTTGSTTGSTLKDSQPSRPFRPSARPLPSVFPPLPSTAVTHPSPHPSRPFLRARRTLRPASS